MLAHLKCAALGASSARARRELFQNIQNILEEPSGTSGTSFGTLQNKLWTSGRTVGKVVDRLRRGCEGLPWSEDPLRELWIECGAVQKLFPGVKTFSETDKCSALEGECEGNKRNACTLRV